VGIDKGGSFGLEAQQVGAHLGRIVKLVAPGAQGCGIDHLVQQNIDRHGERIRP